ncbi:MAG: ADP-ribosylglycohydrolase family protein [Candidatus Bathyarchaeia archaeon]
MRGGRGEGMLQTRLLRSKFQGGIVGSAVGSALGAPFKGLSPDDLDLKPWSLEMMDGRYTCDVKAMMGITESLIEHGGFDGGDAAHRFKTNINSSKKFSVGSVGAYPWMRDGAPWGVADRGLLDRGDPNGNNATASMTAFGLFYYDDLAALREVCLAFGSIIRLHELALEGAMIQAYAVALSVERMPWGGMDPMDLVEEVEGLTGHPLYRDRLRAVKRFLNSPQDKREIIKVLGNSMEPLDSAPTALYCALSKIESFEAAVSYAVGLGGYTDIIAAMTGAISGVLHCLEDIPYRWRTRLEGIDHLSDLADKLLKARESSGAAGHSPTSGDNPWGAGS